MDVTPQSIAWRPQHILIELSLGVEQGIAPNVVGPHLVEVETGHLSCSQRDPLQLRQMQLDGAQHSVYLPGHSWTPDAGMLALLQFLFSRGFSTIYATSCPLFQLHTPAIKAFFVCNPGNPTSMAMDADTRKKLVALIKNSVAYDFGYALGLPSVSTGAWFPLWPEQDRTAAWHCSTPGSR